MTKRKMFFILIITALLCFLFASCKQDTGTVNTVKLCTANFKLNVDGYIDANILTYVIQYRAIPLFGDATTSGRVDNWKTITDDNGSFALANLEEGNWIFYIRIIDGSDILQEINTGTKAITNGVLIELGEAPVYEGEAHLGIFIRADRVAAAQSIKVMVENVKTGTRYDFSDQAWSVTEKGQSFIDYGYQTTVPVGNYVIRVSVISDLSIIAMSGEDSIVVSSRKDAVLTMRLRSQRYEQGSLEVEGYLRYLEGVVTGPVSGGMGKSLTFRYEPLNEYTADNAVWWWWYVDDQRISSQTPDLQYKFDAPGQYLISCVPVGINGEIPENGSSFLQCSIGVAKE